MDFGSPLVSSDLDTPGLGGNPPDVQDISHVRRSTFLKRAAVVGGALAASELVLYGLPRVSSSAPSPAQDRAIFGFMLLLEEIQTAFYDKVLSHDALKGEQLQFAQVVGGQERAHLKYLQTEYGGTGPKVPAIHFGSSDTSTGFVTAAVTLEEVGLGAYNGQAPNLTPDALRRAGRIISVEARHVAWARSLAGELPAPSASDAPLTETEVLSRVREDGYVS